MTRAIDRETTATQQGLTCPHCASAQLFVVYSRKQQQLLKRVRECQHCLRRFVTHERIYGECRVRRNRRPAQSVTPQKVQ